ncbi:hypothetical protein BDN70DRAFT_897805 [Pholiota conissans]|uniref:F-box domain-containing protein n=1 Tax=Pholiota conissans TaxID=109636 RepID=A0A9P5YVH3_9AGAR|nr:hypothetical protein BDN70DRAFT_897805 [Pholiota conissans]
MLESTVKDSSVSKLGCDILWSIFSINSFSYGEHSNDRSPLWTTRKCSQVCSLWREIILRSSSIWGNCIDIDHLTQDQDEWRDEVLRRTGNALMAVYSDHVYVDEDTKEAGFLVNLIENHWERIKILRIALSSADVINTHGVWAALGRPAPHLQAFSVRYDDTERPILRPPGFRLFADDAPVLTEFYIASPIDTSNLFETLPVPPFLFTTRLRTLHLCQAAEVPPDDILAVCEQIPNLEELGVRLNGASSSTSSPSGRKRINLPRLSEMPYNRSSGMKSHETTAKILKDFGRILTQYVDGVFIHRQGVRSLELTLLIELLGCTTSLNPHSAKFILGPEFAIDQLPYDVIGSTINAFSSFSFPETVKQLQVSLFEISDDYRDIGVDHLQFSGDHSVIYASLGRLFSSLESITELDVGTDTLKSIVKIWEMQLAKSLFPWLDVIYLHRYIDDETDLRFLGPFFARPKRNEVYETIDFTKSYIEGESQQFGDLRFLEEFTGMMVVWVQDNQLTKQADGNVLNLSKTKISRADGTDYRDEHVNVT